MPTTLFLICALSFSSHLFGSQQSTKLPEADISIYHEDLPGQAPSKNYFKQTTSYSPAATATTPTPHSANPYAPLWNDRKELYVLYAELWNTRGFLSVQANNIMQEARQLTPDIDLLRERIEQLDRQACPGSTKN